MLKGEPHTKFEIGRKKKLKKAILALSLCHNVTPVMDNDARVLESSSPDELTLVTFA